MIPFSGLPWSSGPFGCDKPSPPNRDTNVLIYCHHYKLRWGTLMFMGECTAVHLVLCMYIFWRTTNVSVETFVPSGCVLNTNVCQAGYDGVLSIIYSLIYWGKSTPYHVSKVHSKLSLHNFLIFANMKASYYTFIIPVNGPIMKKHIECGIFGGVWAFKRKHEVLKSLIDMLILWLLFSSYNILLQIGLVYVAVILK